jgi:hypothetical protein
MRFHWRGGLSALLALAAGLAVALAPDDALAGTRRKLQPPPDSAAPAASGKIRVRESGTDRRIDLRAKGLSPSHAYAVQDANTGETLGSFSTNRRGKGRLRVREDLGGSAQALRDGSGSDGNGGGSCDGSGGDGSSCGDDVCFVVVDEETGEYVLQCEDLGDPVQVDLEFGYEAYWSDDEGTFGSATLFRAVEGDRVEEGYSVALERSTQTDDAISYDLYEIGGVLATGLPLGLKSVKDLEGRAFEIRDADGDVVLEGILPRMEDLGEVPVFDPSGGDDGTGMPKAPEPIDDEQLYFLWLADDDGVLVKVGALAHLYHEDFDPSNCPDFDDIPIPDEGSGDGTAVIRSNALR